MRKFGMLLFVSISIVSSYGFSKCEDVKLDISGPFTVVEVSNVQIACAKPDAKSPKDATSEKAPGCYLGVKQSANKNARLLKLYSTDCANKVGSIISGSLRVTATECCQKREDRKFMPPTCSKTPDLVVAGETIESAARCQGADTSVVLVNK